MKIRSLVVGLVALALSACSAAQSQVVKLVGQDLTVAIQRGEKALGPNDPLVVCYKAVDKVVKAHLEAEQLDGGLLLDAVMQARIIDQTRRAVEKEIQGACSQIALEVMMQAARRGR